VPPDLTSTTTKEEISMTSVTKREQREMTLEEVKKKAKIVGRHKVGRGLYLNVRSKTSKSWEHEFMIRGIRRCSGLGSYRDVPLVEARKQRDKEKLLTRDRIDPVEAKKAERARAAVEQVKNITFEECTSACIKAYEGRWRHPDTRKKWMADLSKWAFPFIGKLRVRDVNKVAVVSILEQDFKGTTLWLGRPNTAERVRYYMERVLNWATAREYRTGENPARWRGYLDQLFPPISKIAKKKHHKALPYAELPEFMRSLRARKQYKFGPWDGGSVSARALEFVILTAARKTEVTEARWCEINLATKLWTIPGERMKNGKEHRVPLSASAISVLTEIQETQETPYRGWRRGASLNREFIFAGVWRSGGINGDALLDVLERMGRQYDVTVHGFRSTFRDWAAEQTDHPNEVVEMALAHTIPNKTEAAYRRGDLLEKRRRLMEAWAAHCNGVAIPTADVIPLRAASA
jgi:integrase